MQTDPIGYEDQMNLYAYVSNDPLNATDPSGMCQKDANGNYSGICPIPNSAGSAAQAQNIVSNGLSDPDSQMSNVESSLVKSGDIIYVQTDSVDISGAQVDGGTTEIGGANGNVVVVTVDLTDKVEVQGVDSKGKPTTRVLTTQEITEHEVVGHGVDAVKGRQSGERRAFGAENRYRSKKGIGFRRVCNAQGCNHRGVIHPNPGASN